MPRKKHPQQPQSKATPSRRWDQLDPALLARIFTLAGHESLPGICWAAPVCRSWLQASTLCRDLRMTYWGSRDKTGSADSFASWLQRYAACLDSWTLREGFVAGVWIDAVSAASAAAIAENDQPLQLTSLAAPDIVKPCEEQVEELLSALPKLQVWDFGIFGPGVDGVVNEGYQGGLQPGEDEGLCEELSSLAGLQQLTQLRLGLPAFSTPTIVRVHATCLPSSLRELQLSSSTLDAATLAPLVNLVKLRLEQVDQLLNSDQLLSLPGLTTVELWNVGVPWQELAALRSKLRVLLPAADEVDGAVLRQLTAVTHLAFEQQLQGDEPLGALTQLRRLDVDEFQWGPSVYLNLHALRELPQRQHLGLSVGGLDQEGPALITIPVVVMLTQLTSLSLTIEVVSHGQVWSLAVAQLTGLQLLGVSQSSVAWGAPWLTALTALTSLRVLADPIEEEDEDEEQAGGDAAAAHASAAARAVSACDSMLEHVGHLAGSSLKQVVLMNFEEELHDMLLEGLKRLLPGIKLRVAEGYEAPDEEGPWNVGLLW